MILERKTAFGYFYCTKNNPYDSYMKKVIDEEVKKEKCILRVVHEDAQEISQLDGYPCGDIVIYKCPHCEEEFPVELPQ